LKDMNFYPGFRGMMIANKTIGLENLRWELVNHYTPTAKLCTPRDLEVRIEFNTSIDSIVDQDEFITCVTDAITASTDSTFILHDTVHSSGELLYLNVTFEELPDLSNYNGTFKVIENFAS